VLIDELNANRGCSFIANAALHYGQSYITLTNNDLYNFV